MDTRTPKIPVLLLTPKTVRRIGRRLKPIGSALAKLQPGMGETLSKMGFDISAGEYMAGSLVSSFLYGAIFCAISLVALSIRGGEELVESAPSISIGVGLVVWLLFFLLHIIYPKITVSKIATKESKDLLFALREIMVDVDSGVPLFDSMKNVATSDYGYVSNDFNDVVKQIESGVPEREALKRLALKSESEYMRRAIWQMVNALESGASMGNALPGIVQSLENHIYREIKSYSSNLNFMMLIYMLSAAAIPSLGITFLVLLSAFGDFGVTAGTIQMLVAASAFIQIVMIGYMSSTRPEVFGG